MGESEREGNKRKGSQTLVATALIQLAAVPAPWKQLHRRSSACSPRPIIVIHPDALLDFLGLC